MPTTLDRKEEIIQWKEHVRLHPIDLSENDLKSNMEIDSFDPSVLEMQNDRGNELRSKIRVVMNKVAILSNQNLVRNAKSHLAQNYKVDPDNKFVWIDDSQESSTRFQLEY